MNLERRVARLEAVTKGIRGSAGGVLLTPYDVCALMIERAGLNESPDCIERGARIDALLASHSRAIVHPRPKSLSPAGATDALQMAVEREENPEAAEAYRRERLAILLAVGQEKGSCA